MRAIPWISLAVSVVVLVSLAPGPASGQPADAGPRMDCDGSESFERCINRLLEEAETEFGELREEVPELAEEKATKEVQAARRKVDEKATPSTNPGTSSALLDFLPALAGTVGIDGVSDSEGNFTFAKAFGPGTLGSLKLGATVFTDAELFEALESKLAEAAEDGLVSRLQDQVGDFDKVDFQASLTREGYLAGRLFGRSSGQYQPSVKKMLEGWAVEQLETGVPSFADWRDKELVKQAKEDYESRAPEGESRSFLRDPIEALAAEDALGAARVAELDATLPALIEDHLRFVRAMDLEDELDLLDELIANQPQLVAEGTYQERRNLTGPDEWAASLSYEIGLSGNLNDFLTWSKKPKNQGTECRVVEGHPGLGCLQGYLDSETRGLQGAVSETVKAERGNRLKLEVKYKKTNAFQLALPEGSLDFELEPSQVWEGSLTYGRYLPSFRLPNLSKMTALDDIDPKQLARFDLEAKYDDVTGDPMRQSRLTVTASVSQKTTNDSVLSVSVMWANKPEYLGEVDEELSANLGLKWQLDKKDDAAKGKSSSNGGGS